MNKQFLLMSNTLLENRMHCRGAFLYCTAQCVLSFVLYTIIMYYKAVVFYTNVTHNLHIVK